MTNVGSDDNGGAAGNGNVGALGVLAGESIGVSEKCLALSWIDGDVLESVHDMNVVRTKIDEIHFVLLLIVRGDKVTESKEFLVQRGSARIGKRGVVKSKDGGGDKLVGLQPGDDLVV